MEEDLPCCEWAPVDAQKKRFVVQGSTWRSVTEQGQNSRPRKGPTFVAGTPVKWDSKGHQPSTQHRGSMQMLAFAVDITMLLIITLLLLVCRAWLSSENRHFVPNYLSFLNSAKSPCYSLFQQFWGRETPSDGLFSSCCLHQKESAPTCHLYLLMSPWTRCPQVSCFFLFIPWGLYHTDVTSGLLTSLWLKLH